MTLGASLPTHMLEINASTLAPKVAQAISLLGWGLPPLDWAPRANQAAKSLLEQAEDQHLFTPQPVESEEMALAVRAMLYLWAGWPDECLMWSAAAPERERLYVQALAYRQQKKAHESKACLQPLTENPLEQLYESLAGLADQLILDSAEAPIKRFRDLIKLGQAWEAFAFTDLFEQARDGKFNHASEEIVRKLQWQEFNQLFHHCYRTATGVDITKSDETLTTRTDTPAWKKNLNTPRVRPVKIERPADADTATAKAAPKRQTPEKIDDKPCGVRIKCPKCNHISVVPDSSRGKPVKCSRCSGVLRVAGGDGQHAAAGKAKMTRLACPKCRSVAAYTESSRGKKVACLKCRTSFLFAA